MADTVRIAFPGGRFLRVAVLDFCRGAVRSALIQDGSFKVLDARSFAELSDLAQAQRPDALVVAFEDPHPEEIDALKSLHSKHQRLRSLIVTRPVSERRITELLKAGAGGLLFTTELSLLRESIRDLVRGGAPMSPPVSRLVMDRARRSSAKMAAVNPRAPTPENLLTPRQREILELLSKGLSYEEMGSALGLSLNTVRTHVRALYDRLGATTKMEAVMLGLEVGLLKKVGR